MKQGYYLLIGLFAVIEIILISGCIQQKGNYPFIIEPLPNEVLQNLSDEFKTLNNNTICNPLDEFGFTRPTVCQPSEILRKEISDENAIIEMAKETIVKNSKFTGVTDKSQLVVERMIELPGIGTSKDQLIVTFKNQIFNGLEVEDTQINTVSDVEKTYRIDAHWYPIIELPEAVLSEEQAKDRLIGKELTYGGTDGKPVSYTIIREDLTGNAEKVILPKYSANNIELRLAWKVPIREHTFWYIYVDAVTGDELKVQQMFQT